jgi:DnaJ-class molecular chaperone
MLYLMDDQPVGYVHELDVPDPVTPDPYAGPVQPHEHTIHCVPCGHAGCDHCHVQHVDLSDECSRCDCAEFAVGDPCTVCGGTGTVERFVPGLGMTEVRCGNEDCNDGVVAA